MGRRDRIDERTIEVLERIEAEEDPRVAWGVVFRRIRAMKEAGRDVPDTLIKVERHLMTDLTSQSQGR
jgi:hypothetical protein